MTTLLDSKWCTRRQVLTFVFAMLAVFTCVVQAKAQEQRIWTSKNGTFEKKATLVESKAGKVTLELEDGKTIQVPVAKLSDEDQAYIASRGDSDAENSVDPVFNLRGSKLAAAIEKRIKEFHEGEENSGEVLRVVYFHGSDTKPQPDYQARLDRNLKDIQDFYHVEMKKNGFVSTPKMPLELVDGKMVVHVVAGKDPNQSYSAHANSARQIRNECKLALRGAVDFGSDYVLIVCGLVRKNGQQYIFNAPNYALPFDHNRGCGFVHDCDKFDVALIRDTRSKISYAKEGKKFVETFAKYNTRRLGAAAHETGHALNLPHNGQTKRDLSRKGSALMGNGNQSYRRQIWDRKHKGAFMTLATSTKLAAHPLFTGSDKDRWKVAKCEFESIVYSRTGSRLEIKGKVQSDPPPLAIIAYADHAEVNIRDYDATSWVGAVGDHGSFHVTVEKHLAGPHELRLAVLLANGATVVPVSIQYDVNKKGVPDVARLNSSQTIGPLEKLLATGRKAEAASAARESLKEFDSSDAEATKELLAQLEHIIALSEPDEVQVLSAVEGNSVFLSDVEWESAEVGYGEPARNRVSLTRKEIAKDKTGILLQVGGRFHAKGIYGHANSSFVFNLDGKWSQFEATVGLQAGAKGLDEFIVKGDGRELYRSKEIAGSVAREFKISVKGVKRLELISKSTITSKGGGWTVWASPLLTR